MFRTVQLLCIPCIACNDIAANEAELIYHALNTTVGEIADQAIQSDQDEVTIEETLSENWEGQIEADGSKELSGNKVLYSLRMHLTEVYVPAQHVSMTGSISVNVDYFLDPTDRESYETALTIGGDVIVTLDASGEADIQYDVVEQYNAVTGSTNFTSEGYISGHDVSLW